MTAGTIPAEHGRECAVAEGTFGPYRLVDRLGAGGMGEVWRAVDTRKSREVALKLIRPDGAADQGFAARFHREAELAARLSSPYIVPIHDYGQIDGQLFLDMALVNGVDLGELLREERRLDPDRAVRLIGQVARALGVAHRAGLVAPTTAVNTTPLPQPTGIPGVTCRAA
jgi:serine/threonine-protein kinase